MKMIEVFHELASQSIKVCECDLASFAEKGWLPASPKKKRSPLVEASESKETE